MKIAKHLRPRRRLSYLELGRRVQLDGLEATCNHLQEAMFDGDINPDDFSIRELAEALIVGSDGASVGQSWIHEMDPRHNVGFRFQEAVSAVDITAFNNITGQIFYNKLMESYTDSAFSLTPLVENIPTRLDGEKIAGITGLVGDAEDIHPGMPYPQLGFGEDYIETPATTKRGYIISITKEVLFFDKTSRVLHWASDTGKTLARRKEKLIARMIFGFDNTFKWKGTTYNTYQSATPWINLKATNGMGDVASGWEKFDASEQLFADLLEPNVGEPVDVNPTHVIHMPARRHQFRRVLSATNIRARENVAAGTADSQTDGPNTLDAYTLVESKYAYRQLVDVEGETAANARDFWIHGDFKKACAWMENWPVTVVQAPDNSEAEFVQDVVTRYKASERGAPAVMDPRQMVKNYEATTI